MSYDITHSLTRRVHLKKIGSCLYRGPIDRILSWLMAGIAQNEHPLSFKLANENFNLHPSDLASVTLTLHTKRYSTKSLSPLHTHIGRTKEDDTYASNMGRPTVLGLSVVLACSGKFVHFPRRMLSISHWATLSQILLHELLGHWPQFFFQFISWEFWRIGVECLWTVVPQCSYPTQHALQALGNTSQIDFLWKTGTGSIRSNQPFRDILIRMLATNVLALNFRGCCKVQLSDGTWTDGSSLWRICVNSSNACPCRSDAHLMSCLLSHVSLLNTSRSCKKDSLLHELEKSPYKAVCSLKLARFLSHPEPNMSKAIDIRWLPFPRLNWVSLLAAGKPL